MTKNHFAINWLIRDWLGLAFRRRSFALLEKASNLAVRCGISMDQVLCDSMVDMGLPSRVPVPNMNHLLGILLTPLSDYRFENPAVDWAKLPKPLRVELGIDAKLEHHSDILKSLGSRMVFIRECGRDCVRFLLSPEFERRIACRDLLLKTFFTNNETVTNLIFSGDSNKKFLRAFNRLVNYHDTPAKPIKYQYFKGRARLSSSAKTARKTVLARYKIFLWFESFDMAYLVIEVVANDGEGDRPPSVAPSREENDFDATPYDPAWDTSELVVHEPNEIATILEEWLA